MPCYHPSRVAVARKSLARPRNRVRFPVTVPCGWCLGCRTDQARHWAIRIMHESDYWLRVDPLTGRLRGGAWFATLTYSPEEVPPHGSLHPSHLRACWSRLRRKFGNLRYYACGEYGERTRRPHYHAVLFGPRFPDRIERTVRSGAPVWESQALNDAWRLGFTELTSVNYKAAAYVAGYVRKKLRVRDDESAYERFVPPGHGCTCGCVPGEVVTIEEEFSRSSRRPAIGRRWIEEYWDEVYPRDHVVMNGVEMKPPRYYDKFMDLPDEKGGSAERREMMAEVRDRRWAELEEPRKGQLEAKEAIHQARVRLFQPRDAV